MKCYLDSSVILRIVLNQNNQLLDFKKIDYAISSHLIKTECYRTLDRARLRGLIEEKRFLSCCQHLQHIFDRIEIILLTDSILERAGRPLGITLGTLDAIHLVSAQFWKEINKQNITFATHDHELAKAAAFHGFQAIG